MRILIAYAGKSGTSEAACQLLAQGLPNHDVTLADLTKTVPVPGDFDYIVLGGAIRMGKAHKALRRYLSAQEQEICKIPHTLFLCCGIPEQFENYLLRTYTAELMESAEEYVYFGGDLDVSKQRGIDRLIARMIRNAIRESEEDEAGLPGILPEHVRMLADRLRGK